MSRISEFLEEIDRRWTAAPADGAKLRLRIIGSSALMLQTGYERGTKDSDVLETASLTADVKDRLIALAGPGTDLTTATRSTSTLFRRACRSFHRLRCAIRSPISTLV